MIMGKESASKIYEQLKEKLTHAERIFYALPFSLIAKIPVGRLRRTLAHLVLSSTRSHPRIHMPKVEGRFQTILDVFEQVNPASYVETSE